MFGLRERQRVADRGGSSRGCEALIFFVQADHFLSRDLFHVEQDGGPFGKIRAGKGED
tara:strand:- start:33 stop:206 length:174 start_codon:yes stop_codon:yes gene_type:complete